MRRGPMRILLVHNFYQQPGGEDSVVRGEMEALIDAGHEVMPFFVHNDNIHGVVSKIKVYPDSLGSRKSLRL